MASTRGPERFHSPRGPGRWESIQTSGLPGVAILGWGRVYARRTTGVTLEAHGGYLIRVESLETRQLVELARRALVDDGASLDSVLAVSVYPKRKIVRLALDGPQTAGRLGAHWYSQHHALARLLSHGANLTVQAYVYDPQEYEQVLAFGRGQYVGGERLLYDDVELPESQEGEFDDEAFTRMQARWPLGHLAWVFGVERDLLLQLHRLPLTRLRLDGAESGTRLVLEQLLRGIAA